MSRITKDFLELFLELQNHKEKLINNNLKDNFLEEDKVFFLHLRRFRALSL